MEGRPQQKWKEDEGEKKLGSQRYTAVTRKMALEGKKGKEGKEEKWKERRDDSKGQQHQTSGALSHLFYLTGATYLGEEDHL